MLEQLKYINHINEVFEFGKYGVYVDTNDLRNYDWSVVSKSDKISGFKRQITNRSLPVIILCETEELAVAAKNRLFEVVEKDILAEQPGKIIIGDYYYKCFVVGSKKSDYLRTKRMLKTTLTLTTDQPYWVKESTFVFGAVGSHLDIGGEDQDLDFAFDYPFDFSSNNGSAQLANGSFVDSNFRMLIHGACVDPVVYIAEHAYQVNCTVAEGEYLTIDAVSKKIYITAVDGTTRNVYNLRNRDSYIFKKIPSGGNPVGWNGEFSISIVLLEERSEPKWT